MALQVLKGPFTIESYQRLAELGVLEGALMCSPHLERLPE
jgi:hypothetical protein